LVNCRLDTEIKKEDSQVKDVPMAESGTSTKLEDAKDGEKSSETEDKREH